MTSKQFIRYLKEKGCYFSWEKQAKEHIKRQIESGSIMLCHQCGTNLKKFVEYFIKSKTPQNIIMYSLKWRDTEEGSSFWYDIHKELSEITNNEKKIEECYVGNDFS